MRNTLDNILHESLEFMTLNYFKDDFSNIIESKDFIALKTLHQTSPILKELTLDKKANLKDILSKSKENLKDKLETMKHIESNELLERSIYNTERNIENMEFKIGLINLLLDKKNSKKVSKKFGGKK